MDRLDAVDEPRPTNRAELRAIERVECSRPIADTKANAATALDLPRIPATKHHATSIAWNDERLGEERYRAEYLKVKLNLRASAVAEIIFNTDIAAFFEAAEAMHAQAEIFFIRYQNQVHNNNESSIASHRYPSKHQKPLLLPSRPQAALHHLCLRRFSESLDPHITSKSAPRTRLKPRLLRPRVTRLVTGRTPPSRFRLGSSDESTLSLTDARKRRNSRRHG